MLLDTDTLSLLRRGHASVSEHARAYLGRHGRLAFTELTWYEAVRGYRVIHAHRQLEAFEAFCRHCDVVPLSRNSLERAADIYAELHRRGQLIGEVDILIGAIALVRGMGVATRNTSHFSRIDGLHVEDWTVSMVREEVDNGSGRS